jgi:hypothetical protein
MPKSTTASLQRKRPVRQRNRRNPGIRRPIHLRPHQWKLKQFNHTAQSLGTGVVVGAKAIQLDDLSNYLEYSALFDQYMITGVKIDFIPKHNVSEMGSTRAVPVLHFWRDHDDATAPSTTLNTALENQSVKTRMLNRPQSFFLKPSILVEAYRGVASTSYSPKWKQWIDMAHADVPHYGYKYFIEDAGFAAAEDICDVFLTLYFKTRGVR